MFSEKPGTHRLKNHLRLLLLMPSPSVRLFLVPKALTRFGEMTLFHGIQHKFLASTSNFLDSKSGEPGQKTLGFAYARWLAQVPNSNNQNTTETILKLSAISLFDKFVD